MEVPLAFPPSSCHNPGFLEGFSDSQVHFPRLRMMLAKRGRGTATTSQAAGAACQALKDKHPIVAKNVASKTINK